MMKDNLLQIAVKSRTIKQVEINFPLFNNKFNKTIA